MAGTGPGDLYALATELLEACAEALDTIPTYEPSLEGAQTRQFISPGQPADDCCDQLSVQVSALRDAPTSPVGLAAGTKHRSGRVNHVILIVRSTRCVPMVDGKGNFPTAQALSDSAQQLDADAWALWTHLFNLLHAKLLFESCGEVHWDGGLAAIPSGGCGGWTFTFRVTLDGYEEVLGT